MSTGRRIEDYHITPEEYLAAERLAERRHEYIAGIVVAMADATREHARITGNITGELYAQLHGKRCEAFAVGLKVHIPAAPTAFYYYPDIVVDCSGADKNAVEEPTVIFEVLSPETERIDVGEEFSNYRSLPSLRVYVLVNQFNPAVTIYRRSGETWNVEFLGRIDAVLELPEIACGLPLAAIYRRMSFAA